MQRGVSSRRSGKRTLDYAFEPIVLAFKELHYYVPNPAGAGELELLRGVSGVFKPGVLTALMGASGAGKSTLMDVISGAPTPIAPLRRAGAPAVCGAHTRSGVAHAWPTL